MVRWLEELGVDCVFGIPGEPFCGYTARCSNRPTSDTFLSGTSKPTAMPPQDMCRPPATSASAWPAPAPASPVS